MALKLSRPAIDIYGETHQHTHESPLVRYLVVLGRLLFSLIFLISSVGHFSAATVDYARSQGVPLAGLLVPLSGIIAMLGGLSILIGYRAKTGALLLILFLIPVTLMMHDFWNIGDQAVRQLEQINFFKNLAILGGAILIFYFGAGPMSMDSQKRFGGTA